MKKTKQFQIKVVEDHLEKLNSGLRFDIESYNYGLKDLSKKDWICYKALIEMTDEDRINMSGNFNHITNNKRKLADLFELDKIRNENYEKRGNRIKAIIKGGNGHEKGIDLFTDRDFEIVFIGEAVNSGPLFVMDGTHRMIAHYLTHERSIENVPCYLCIHPKIKSWSWFPGS